MTTPVEFHVYPCTFWFSLPRKGFFVKAHPWVQKLWSIFSWWTWSATTYHFAPFPMHEAAEHVDGESFELVSQQLPNILEAEKYAAQNGLHLWGSGGKTLVFFGNAWHTLSHWERA